MTVIPLELQPGPLPASFRPRPPLVDGSPSRAVASWNLRHEDKRVLALLQSFWEAKLGRDLSHWDVIAILLAAAFENPRLDVPEQLRKRRAS